MDTISTTKTISAHLSDKVIQKVEKLNKRAAKIGATPLRVEFANERIEKEVDPAGVAATKYRKVVDATVIGAAPIVNGWELAAKIEHTELGNLIRTSPRFKDDLPVEFRDAAPNCDHCKINRVRHNTFVMRHENGEWAQIGSSCLVDFIGNDPENALWVFDELGEFDESEQFEGFSSGPLYFPIEDYLTHVAAAIRLNGWVSRSDTYIDKPATADVASLSICPPPNGGPLPLEDTDKAEAEKALAWVREVEASNDFLHNINLVGRMEHITFKEFGFAAAIVMAYQREQDRLRRVEREAKMGANSEWVGKVKERREFTLKVERVFAKEGNYGLTYITTLYDENGNLYTWFASKNLEVGKTYTGKATVKDHTEFRGAKQTVITRFTPKEV